MKRRNKRSWTEQENALLKKCVSQGMEIKDLVPLFPNRNVEAIKHHRWALGCKKPPATVFPHDDITSAIQIYKFRRLGWRLQDIKNITGVSTKRLSWLLKYWGLPTIRATRMPTKEKRTWSELELAQLRRHLQRKTSLNVIYQSFSNRTQVAVRKKVWQITRYWLSDAEQEERQQMRMRYNTRYSKKVVPCKTC